MFSSLMDLMRGGNIIYFILDLFSILVVLFVAFPIHECAHGLMAKFLGDDTAEKQGRLTVNPIAHLDMFGTISMLMFGIGWAKPVPVNVNRCRKVKSGKAAMAITAIAGPISNLILSYFFIIIAKLVILAGGGDATIGYIAAAIVYAARLNIFLAVFNLLPIPPFDGSRLFLVFLKPKTYFKIMQYERYIMIGILLLLWTGILSIPLNWISNWVLSGLDVLSGFLGTVF